jgi:hypothetical protein
MRKNVNIYTYITFLVYRAFYYTKLTFYLMINSFTKYKVEKGS